MASPLAATAAASDARTRPSDEEVKAGKHEIPLKLTLGAATLALGASGQWELDHSALSESVARARVLEERNAALEAENARLKEKCTRMTEESNMEKFKCQLLIEMLAVSSLDEERSRTQAEQEKARAGSMRADMVSLLEQARKEGVDVRKISAALGSGGSAAVGPLPSVP